MAVTVGFIGVGNMGNPMAGNVLKAGFPMTVYDKHGPAVKNLIDGGAKEGRSAQDVGERSEIALPCLPASPDVEALSLDAGGLVERAKPGNVLIDLSSVLPSTPRKIEPRAKERGVFFLEAPVSGGVSGARAATLAIMAGGGAGGARGGGARGPALRPRTPPMWPPRAASTPGADTNTYS